MTLIFALSILAILYGALLSGRYFFTTANPDERRKGYSISKTAYGLSIFILLLLFHRQMHVVAGAWAILALGDSAASIVGRRWGRRKLPWNRHKSPVGLAAFFTCGTIGCWFLVRYTIATGDYANVPQPASLFFASAIAAGIGGLGESLDCPVDDNFIAPLLAGLSLYLCSPLMGL